MIFFAAIISQTVRCVDFYGKVMMKFDEVEKITMEDYEHNYEFSIRVHVPTTYTELPTLATR